MFMEGLLDCGDWGKWGGGNPNSEAAFEVFLGGDGFYEDGCLLVRLECLRRGRTTITGGIIYLYILPLIT